MTPYYNTSTELFSISFKTETDVSLPSTPVPRLRPYHDHFADIASTPLSYPSTPSLSSGSSTSSSGSPYTPSSSPAPTKLPRKIPRPPNAFMLYRSDLLKSKVIPAHAEKRQQALSKVAGQCWQMLEKEKKDYWKDQAAKELERHQKLYPDYKFNPTHRGSSRKAKTRNELDEASEDKIRELREMYTKIAGPAPPGSREKRKKNTKKNRSKLELGSPFQHFSRPSDVDSSSSAQLPYPADSTESPMPPFFPQPSYPHLPMDYSFLAGVQEPQFSLDATPCSTPDTALSIESGLNLDTKPNDLHHLSCLPSTNQPLVLNEGQYQYDHLSCLPATNQPLVLNEGQYQYDQVNVGYDAFPQNQPEAPFISLTDLQADQTVFDQWCPVQDNNFDYSTWNLTPDGGCWVEGAELAWTQEKGGL
ncbi:hypothetical protein VKT23_002137 [Stygiomarasmius scandens]|uniref:HMG box domain-containing protein n=1 Tax=Marasmiellus scandens TaxID=2682957 RepID=A0ABR1K127_9AGAR